MLVYSDYLWNMDIKEIDTKYIQARKQLLEYRIKDNEWGYMELCQKHRKLTRNERIIDRHILKKEVESGGRTMIERRVSAYKLARPDGFDFYTGKTINYRRNIGKVVSPPKPNVSLGVCSFGVLHASSNPNDCFVGAKIPCSAYEVSGIPACGDIKKWGFTELTIIREIKNLDKLFGWRYSGVLNPIHPLKLSKVTKITDKQLELLKRWASVGASVGASVRASVWDSVWDSVGASVGASVRASVWDSVGDSVGASVWDSVGASVGASVWASVGASVGASV